jgi:hypothetical protein
LHDARHGTIEKFVGFLWGGGMAKKWNWGLVGALTA